MFVARSTLLAVVLLATVPATHADPEVDYLLHCSGCHMPDGSGLQNVVPTLHDVIGRMVAEPEGRSYIVRVPGSSQAPVSDEKLAAILNWMLTEFSSATLPRDFQPLSAQEVGKARGQLLADPLRYRAEHFPNYE